MSAKAITQIPTLVLRGIDPQSLYDRYKKSEFLKIEMPSLKIEVDETLSIILAPTYTENPSDAISFFRDKNNASIIMASSSQKPYESFLSSGGKLPENGRCFWCLQDFEGGWTSVPLVYKKVPVILTEESLKETLVHTFWCEGCFCSYECTLAHIRLHSLIQRGHQDINYLHAEAYLRLMYSLQYPEAESLEPAKDFRLLKSNYGSLTNEEFRSRKHTYIRTTNLVMIPCKVQYIQH